MISSLAFTKQIKTFILTIIITNTMTQQILVVRGKNETIEFHIWLHIKPTISRQNLGFCLYCSLTLLLFCHHYNFRMFFYSNISARKVIKIDEKDCQWSAIKANISDSFKVIICIMEMHWKSGKQKVLSSLCEANRHFLDLYTWRSQCIQILQTGQCLMSQKPATVCWRQCCPLCNNIDYFWWI